MKIEYAATLQQTRHLLRPAIQIILISFVILLGVRSAQAATVVVSSGGNLQAAIDSAQAGDTIVLEAGASFMGPITLPNKAGATA